MAPGRDAAAGRLFVARTRSTNAASRVCTCAPPSTPPASANSSPVKLRPS